MFIDLYVHFSALETALLPYFLFVLYGAIALYIKSEMVGRVYVKPEPEPTPPVGHPSERAEASACAEEGISPAACSEPSAYSFLEPEVEMGQDYLISVPCPWVPELESQFEMELITRTVLPMTEEDYRELPPIKSMPKSKRKPSKSMSELIAMEMKLTEPAHDPSN